MSQRPLKIYIFCCTNSIDLEEMSAYCREAGEDHLKIVGLPCSGKIDVPYLIKAFETGADGAVIVTCKVGECTYLEGNLRAVKRAEAVDKLLEEIGYGSGRMEVIQLSEGPEQILREVAAFREKVKALPLINSNSEKRSSV
jgi:F420-non-reducing hydrogenase iron-sulfur subunit